jgi:NAD(P)-dependent dehydrogenase (short-subunit alcohol dehydrogenase family)
MQGERTYVMTGATSGMGLVLARKLAQSPERGWSLAPARLRRRVRCGGLFRPIG